MSKHLLSLAVICAFIGAGVAEDKDEKGEKDETTVTLDQVPAAVQAAIKTAATGGTVKEIEKETKHGKTVYEAEIVGADGKTKEVKFDENGKEIVKGDHQDEK